MDIKYKGKTITVPDDFVIKMGQHAAAREMTLEEYIVEAFTRFKKSEEEEEEETESCGNLPVGWISTDENS